MAKNLKPLKLSLKERSYSIEVGQSSAKSLVQFLTQRKARLKRDSRVFLIRDERLSEPAAQIVSYLEAKKISVMDISVRAGESLKDIESVYPLYGKLLEGKANRDSVLVALGGGSIGDAAGFVAATYMRGIDWVGLPTTLLAQVDSSVGGKTGINHESGKNLIGAFHQPSLVIVDTAFLKTLGPREIISGVGEIAKYSLTFDSKFFTYLEENLSALLNLDPTVLTYSIHRSLDWKCKAVSKDEFDRTGVREVLNFGHTFGHALESATHYELYQHGEAVIWGMRFALALSQVRNKLKSAERTRMDRFLRQLPVPGIPSNLDAVQIFKFMKKDKKAEGDVIRFVLLDRLGHSVSDKGVKLEHLHQAYQLMMQEGPL